MSKQSGTCLLIGDAGHSEWRSAAEWLREHVHVVIQATPTAALATIHTLPVFDLPVFDLIVVAQSRPGQFSASDIESLHRAWPLAKLLGLHGSWCEGEGRTGRPWPGVWRIPAGNGIRKLRELFAVDQPGVNRGAKWPDAQNNNLVSARRTATSPTHDQPLARRSRSWLLPRLISDAERYYYDATEQLVHGSGEVVISAATSAAYESLADAVGQIGFETTWQRLDRLPANTGPTAAIWDAVRGTDAEWRAIHEMAKSIAPAPLVILLGFPRLADFQRTETYSASLYGMPNRMGILPKPFRLADLCTELARMTGITLTSRALETPA